MTHHVMEQVRGNKTADPRPMPQYVDKKVAGAGMLGSKLRTNGPRDHAGVTTEYASPKHAVVPGHNNDYLVIDEYDVAFAKKMGLRVAKAFRERNL